MFGTPIPVGEKVAWVTFMEIEGGFYPVASRDTEFGALTNVGEFQEQVCGKYPSVTFNYCAVPESSVIGKRFRKVEDYLDDFVK